MKTIRDLKDFLKDAGKRHSKDMDFYIMTEDGEKWHALQLIKYENGKPVLYLKAVRI